MTFPPTRYNFLIITLPWRQRLSKGSYSFTSLPQHNCQSHEVDWLQPLFTLSHSAYYFQTFFYYPKESLNNSEVCVRLLRVPYSSYSLISQTSPQSRLLIFPRFELSITCQSLTRRGRRFRQLYIAPPNRILCYQALYPAPFLYFGFSTSSLLCYLHNAVVN